MAQGLLLVSDRGDDPIVGMWQVKSPLRGIPEAVRHPTALDR
jgi:hypothetical protein